MLFSSCNVEDSRVINDILISAFDMKGHQLNLNEVLAAKKL